MNRLKPNKWHLLLSDKSTDHVIKIGNKDMKKY